MAKVPPEHASRYRYFVPITTRWMDNDVYGHVNNVVYYSYFDSAANHFLIHEGGLDIHSTAPDAAIGVVVESGCHYHAPLAYPAALRAGLRVDALGARSVTWGIGVFTEGGDDAAAHGTFTHVFVDRASRKPVPIPARVRAALERILAPSAPR